MASAPTFAQIDIQTLNGMSDSQIKRIFGTPTNYIFGGPDEDCHFYYFPDATVVQTDCGRDLYDFQTESPKYCILTKYISGGIKVGDPFSKLQSIDFSKVDYGRGKADNALTFLANAPSNDYNYAIFQKEYHSVYFRVENGVITKWGFFSASDLPYEHYDLNIKFW